MAISAASALIFLPLVLPICILAAWSDMARMKIPNAAVIALVLTFLVLAPLALPFAEIPWRLLTLAVVLVIGFALNMIGAIGAGDAKFAAAMAPFIDPGDAARFAYLFACVILVAFATHRAARRLPPIRRALPDWESWDRKDFPMGLALGGGLAIYLVAGAISGA